MTERIELLPKGYRAVCAICGAPTHLDDYPPDTKPFRTLTIGDSPTDSFAACVVQFCPEHLATGDAEAVLRTWFTTKGRTQITGALGQWDLPDGTYTPVLLLGVLVYPDGRAAARIIPLDEEVVAKPLEVPVDQVATWTPPR